MIQNILKYRSKLISFTVGFLGLIFLLQLSCCHAEGNSPSGSTPSSPEIPKIPEGGEGIYVNKATKQIFDSEGEERGYVGYNEGNMKLAPDKMPIGYNYNKMTDIIKEENSRRKLEYNKAIEEQARPGLFRKFFGKKKIITPDLIGIHEPERVITKKEAKPSPNVPRAPEATPVPAKSPSPPKSEGGTPAVHSPNRSMREQRRSSKANNLRDSLTSSSKPLPNIPEEKSFPATLPRKALPAIPKLEGADSAGRGSLSSAGHAASEGHKVPEVQHQSEQSPSAKSPRNTPVATPRPEEQAPQPPHASNSLSSSRQHTAAAPSHSSQEQHSPNASSQERPAPRRSRVSALANKARGGLINARRKIFAYESERGRGIKNGLLNKRPSFLTRGRR